MAQFPVTVPNPLDLLVARNNKFAELTLTVGSGDTIIPADSTADFPDTGCFTFEDDTFEIVFYTGKTPTSFTGCTRGFDGTTAVPHNAGVTLGMWQNALYHNVLVDEVIAVAQNLANRIGLDPLRLRFAPGSAVSPTVVPNNDATTGLFSSGVGALDIAANGTHVGSFVQTGFTLLPGRHLRVGSASSPRSTANLGASDVVTIGRATAPGHFPVIELAGQKTAENTAVGRISFLNEYLGGGDNRIAEMEGIVWNADNSGALVLKTALLGVARSYQLTPNSFAPDGFLADLGTVTNKWNTLHVNSLSITGVFSADTIRFGDGTLAAPGAAFTLDTDTGLRRLSSDRMSIVTGGFDRIVVNDAGRVGIATMTPEYPLHIVATAPGEVRDLVTALNGVLDAVATGTAITLDVLIDGNVIAHGASRWARRNDGRMILSNTADRYTVIADARGMEIAQAGEHPIIFSIASAPAVTFRNEPYPAATIEVASIGHAMNLSGFQVFYTMHDTNTGKNTRLRSADGSVLWLSNTFDTLMSLTEAGVLSVALGIQSGAGISAIGDVSAGGLSSAFSAFRSGNGSALLPAYSFTGQANTGLFLSTGAVHYSKNGVDQGEILAGSAGVSFPLEAPDGSSGAPSYSWENAPTWGFYRLSQYIVLAMAGVGKWSYRWLGAGLPLFGLGTLSPEYMIDANYDNDDIEEQLEAFRVTNRRYSDNHAFSGSRIAIRQATNNAGAISDAALIERFYDGRLRIRNTSAIHTTHTANRTATLETESGKAMLGVESGSHWIGIDDTGAIGLDRLPTNTPLGSGLAAPSALLLFGRNTGADGTGMVELAGKRTANGSVGQFVVTNQTSVLSRIETSRTSLDTIGQMGIYVAQSGGGEYGMFFDGGATPFRTIRPTADNAIEFGLATHLWRSVYAARHLGDFLFLYNSGRTAAVGHAAKAALATNPTYRWPEDGAAGEVLSTDGSGNLSWVVGGGVSWPLTATDYLDMDGNEIRLGNLGGALITWSDAHGSIYLSADSDHLYLASAKDFSMYANTGTDGTGAWSPGIDMQQSGIVGIFSTSGVTPVTNYLSLIFNQGVSVNGFNPAVRFERTGALDRYLEIGYDSDGSAQTGARIRGTNLVVEATSNLTLQGTQIVHPVGSATVPSITFAGNLGYGLSLIGGEIHQILNGVDQGAVGGGGVTWPLTATDYLDMDGNILYFWQDTLVPPAETNTAYLKLGPGGSIEGRTANVGGKDHLYFAAQSNIALFANAGIDGAGNWSVGLDLWADYGSVAIYSYDESTKANNVLDIYIWRGLNTIGFNEAVRIADGYSPSYLGIGYDSNGTVRTGARIRSQFNLALESTGGSVSIQGTQVVNPVGSATVPGITFAENLGYGLSLVGGELRYVKNGVDQGEIGGGMSFPILAPKGTATAPAYSFDYMTDSGMFLDDDGGTPIPWYTRVALVHDGVDCLSVNYRADINGQSMINFGPALSGKLSFVIDNFETSLHSWSSDFQMWVNGSLRYYSAVDGKGIWLDGAKLTFYTGDPGYHLGDIDFASGYFIFARNGNHLAVFAETSTPDETSFLLYDVNSGSMQTVLVGGNSSGGVGFRMLRVPDVALP